MSQEKILLALDLDPHTAIDGTGLPHHVTLVPPFVLDIEKIPLVIECVRMTVADMPFLEVVGASENQFQSADSQEILRVRTIVRSAGICALHRLLLEIVKEEQQSIDIQYTGDYYRPHVTIRDNRCITEGETIMIDAVTLFAKGNAVWRRQEVMPFHGE